MVSTINHESVRTGCRHHWHDVGPQFGSHPTECSQRQICKRCGIEAKITWNDQNDIPPIRRKI